jgi:hypothetical protein
MTVTTTGTVMETTMGTTVEAMTGTVMETMLETMTGTMAVTAMGTMMGAIVLPMGRRRPGEPRILAPFPVSMRTSI